MKIYWNGKSKNIIGNNVKKLRKQRKISQKAMAEKLQLNGFEFSDLTILRIEQGTRFVPDYEVVAIAEFFGVTTDELMKTEL
ncbi:MAG: helix-turn-helix transcriptional regulator [Clostridia bacterium]|nr:helix-turn-helix transcriptional regulator [Oscillospiraceae bacterium]MBR3809524.1 helix-turn-helix transcriptional regulator [Clostridia bacterium]